MKKTLCFASLFALCFAFALALGGCAAGGAGAEGTSEEGTLAYTSLDELDGKTIGVQTGSIQEQLAPERFPNSPVLLFDASADACAAMKNGKIDAFLTDESDVIGLERQIPGIGHIDESLFDQYFGAVFAKNSEHSDALRAQFDEWVTRNNESGLIDSLLEKWKEGFDKTSTEAVSLTGKNGKISVITSATVTPYAFVRAGEIVGFEPDLVNLFCEEYGYIPEYTDVTFSGIIPSIVSGKSDLAISQICITDERKQSVNFSEPYTQSNVIAVVLKDGGGAGFLEGAATGFNKTFVEEQRWQLIARGVGTTLLISIVAALIGTLVGFLIYLLCRRGNKVLNAIFDVLARIIGGLPVVILLMIFYYIVLAKAPLSGAVVSMAAFSLSMALTVYSQLKVAVKSIDRGQVEGAASLGFTDRQAFFKIILPQSMEQFIPNYEGALIGLVQGTSIVGYIAVQDLTRVSDIIRGRTYDAFFPLISSAIIYLLLGWLLTILIRRVARLFEPKRRSSEQVMAQYSSTKCLAPRKQTVDFSGAALSAEEAAANVVLRFQHVRKAYPNVTPIADLNAVVHRGDSITLIGPSGTGKSTLLRMTNMLEAPTSGQILFRGVDITAPGFPLHEMRGRIGMVFQSFNLFNNMTIIENVTFAPTQLKGVSPHDAYERGMELLDKVGLADFALAYPSNLSGGQKQRAAIARTIAMNPEVILLDEPTSALDPAMVEEVEMVIRDLAKEGYTMMMVTHDMDLAEHLANRVFFLCDGGLCEDDTPEVIFHHPKKEQTRVFIKRLKTLELVIDSAYMNFPDMVTEINTFAFKNNVDANLARKIKSIFEELCLQIIRPKMMEGASKIKFSLNYSSKEKSAVIITRYRGVDISPSALLAKPLDDAGGIDDLFALMSDDVLAWKLIQTRADKVVFSKAAEDDYDGKITIKLE